MRVIFNLIKFIVKWVFLLALFIAAVGYWTLKIEPQLLVTKHVDLYIPNWDKKLDGFKVALISDMHIDSQVVDLNKIEKIVENTNRENPDLILLLGDFDTLTIKESGINKKDIAETFKKFEANYDVIAVLGNHDIKPPNVIRKMLQDSGMTVLENDSTHITAKGRRVNIVGVKDWWHFKNEIESYLSTLSIVSPTILLSHNPDIFPEVPQNVSLTLSGHTHGGHIRLPLLGGLFSPSDYGQRLIKGHIAENNKHIYVSSGIGGIPARLGNVPEIVIISLYSQEDREGFSDNTEPNQGIKRSLMPLYLEFLESPYYEKYFLTYYEKLI